MAQGAAAQAAMNRAQVDGLKKVIDPMTGAVSTAAGSIINPVKDYLSNTQFGKDVLAKDQAARQIQAAQQRRDAEQTLAPPAPVSAPIVQPVKPVLSPITTSMIKPIETQITKNQLIDSIKSKINAIPDKSDPQRKALIARLTELI